MAEIFTHTAENGVSVVQIQSPDFDSLELREILLEQLPSFLRLFLEKNAEYGDNAHVLGPRGQFADIWRKIGKLKTALWDDNEDQLTSESADDVLRDLIGHCFLALQQRARLRPQDEDGADSEDLEAVFTKAQTGGEWPTSEQSTDAVKDLFGHMFGDLTPAEEIERGPGSGGDGVAIDEKISAPNGDSRWPFGPSTTGLVGHPNGRPNDLVTRVSSGPEKAVGIPRFDPTAAEGFMAAPLNEIDIRSIIRREMAAVAEHDVEPVETGDDSEWPIPRRSYDWREATARWFRDSKNEFSIRITPPMSSGLKPFSIYQYGGFRFVQHSGTGPVYQIKEIGGGDDLLKVKISTSDEWFDARFFEPEHGAQLA